MPNEGVYSDFYQIIESTFSNAVSSQHGGAISCDSQSLKVCIIYSSFLSCVSTYSSSSDGGGGGACYLNIDQGVLQYTYCNKCQSPIIGSAIYLESKSLNDLNSSCLSAIFCCPYSKANLQSIYGYMRGTCNIDNINISNCISQNYYGALHFGLDPVFISSSYINIVFDNSDSYRYPLSTSLTGSTTTSVNHHYCICYCKGTNGIIGIWNGNHLFSEFVVYGCSGELIYIINQNSHKSVVFQNSNFDSSLSLNFATYTQCSSNATMSLIQMICSRSINSKNTCLNYNTFELKIGLQYLFIFLMNKS